MFKILTEPGQQLTVKTVRTELMVKLEPTEVTVHLETEEKLVTLEKVSTFTQIPPIILYMFKILTEPGQQLTVKTVRTELMVKLELTEVTVHLETEEKPVTLEKVSTFTQILPII